MAEIYTIGMTGEEFVSALNMKKVFNVLNYGVLADDSTDNTTALQAVIEAAKVKGGTVYIPGGTYKTRTLTTYSNVLIKGDGISTILKSIAAEPLIQMLYTDYNRYQDMGICDMRLLADSVGTVGIYFQAGVCFRMQNVHVFGFSEKGLYFKGSLVGSLDNCFFRNNYIGIYAEGYVGSPNLITIKGGQILGNTKYGVYWQKGAVVRFDNVDFEDNGTNGDNTTGAVYYNMETYNSGDQTLGMIFTGCWFESNYGIVANFSDVTLCNLTSIFSDCMFISNTNCEYEIMVNGTTASNRVILRNSFLKGDNNLYIEGAYASVVNIGSFVKYTITEHNGGKYLKTISYTGRLTLTQYSGALTDDTPSDAEIDAIIGSTPAAVGAGWQCTIKDSNGTGLLYKIESDGTNWLYTKMTIAT